MLSRRKEIYRRKQKYKDKYEKISINKQDLRAKKTWRSSVMRVRA